MNKHDFSYYTERAQVLNEMARPSQLLKLGESGKIVDQLFNQVGKIMRDGNIPDSEGNTIPGLPLNVHKSRVLRYFLYMLNENTEENLEDDESPEEDNGVVRSRDGLVNLSKRLLNIPLDKTAKEYGYLTADALYRAAIYKSVENKLDYVKSPEFKEKVLNTTTIADYMRQGRVATHSDYSVNKAKEQEDKYGAPIEDIHSAQMDIKDILTNIHKAMGYKRRKLTNNSNNQTPTGAVDNDFTENIFNILKTLEELSVFKKVLDRITSSNVDMGTEDNDQSGIFRKALQVNQMLDKPLDESEIASLAVLPRDRTGNTILEDLIEQFSDLKETGIPMEDFKNEIQDIISYTPVETHPVLNLILKDVTTSENATDEYTGYDSEVLKQYITSPEIKEAFGRYYQWYVNNMYDRMEKAKEQLEYSKAGYEEYKGMLPELRRNYAAFLAKWDTINKGKQKAYANSLRVSDDDVLAKHNISPEDLGDDYVASKIKSSKYNESYVMNYMTEQVSKDRFKPKGEFKDRGFKKMNYLEWLEKNQ